MLSDVTAVTCQKSRHFGYCKWSVVAYCPDTIGVIAQARFFLSGLTPADSPSMHGTLLDQRVFESLVTQCLPVIHDHFQEVDVQLSVASLPWFLSLYVSAMCFPAVQF